jgi:putative nucleotidyltransferase with HDIG domain
MGAKEFSAVVGPALQRLSEVVPGATAAIGVGGDEQNYLVFSLDSSGATRCRSASFDTPRPITEEELIVGEIGSRCRALFADSLPPNLAWTFFTLGGEAHANGLVALASPRPLDGEERESVRRLCDRLGAALAQVRLVRQLDAMNDGMLKTLAMIVDASSHWTAGHSERVSEYAVLIGERMGLPGLELDTLRRGALLHDLGKVGIPAGILDKIGVLSERERRLVERHTVIGAEILSPLAAFADLIPIVRSHHERWDGSGYPDGLCGEEIPLLARIVAVADVFDALVSERPYRPGLSVQTTVAMMRSEAGVKLDRMVVEAFLHVLNEGAVEVVAGSWRESTMVGGHLRLTALEVLP